MTGIAIVGQGYMGRTHAEAWKRLGYEDSIQYVVAPGERLWHDLAPAAVFTSSLDAALRDPSVDRVCVCTPTPTHADIAIRSLRAGKHVLVEKPISLNVEDARAMAAEASASSTVLMVAQVVRFFAGYQELAAIAASGRIGNLLSVRAARMLARPLWAPWWPDEKQSGGVPVDFAVHDYDQANVLLGRPVAVQAVRTSHESPLEVAIEYADGGLAQVLSFPYLPQASAFSSTLELIGSSGHAQYRLLSGAPTDSTERNVSELTVATTGGIERRAVADNDPYAREIEYFADCIASRRRPSRSSAESAITALQVALAVRLSLAQQARVTL